MPGRDFVKSFLAQHREDSCQHIALGGCGEDVRGVVHKWQGPFTVIQHCSCFHNSDMQLMTKWTKIVPWFLLSFLLIVGKTFYPCFALWTTKDENCWCMASVEMPVSDMILDWSTAKEKQVRLVELGWYLPQHCSFGFWGLIFCIFSANALQWLFSLVHNGLDDRNAFLPSICIILIYSLTNLDMEWSILCSYVNLVNFRKQYNPGFCKWKSW